MARTPWRSSLHALTTRFRLRAPTVTYVFHVDLLELAPSF
jgi:hypothetical protein